MIDLNRREKAMWHNFEGNTAGIEHANLQYEHHRPCLSGRHHVPSFQQPLKIKPKILIDSIKTPICISGTTPFSHNVNHASYICYTVSNIYIYI